MCDEVKAHAYFSTVRIIIFISQTCIQNKQKLAPHENFLLYSTTCMCKAHENISLCCIHNFCLKSNNLLSRQPEFSLSSISEHKFGGVVCGTLASKVSLLSTLVITCPSRKTIYTITDVHVSTTKESKSVYSNYLHVYA